MAKKDAPAAPAKKAAAAKPVREKIEANGVTRPAVGTKTGNVWAAADKISKTAKRPAERSEVMAACVAEGIPEATIATQYQLWRKFFGIPKKVAAPKPPKVAKVAKKAAAKKAAPAAPAQATA